MTPSDHCYLQNEEEDIAPSKLVPSLRMEHEASVKVSQVCFHVAILWMLQWLCLIISDWYRCYVRKDEHGLFLILCFWLYFRLKLYSFYRRSKKSIFLFGFFPLNNFFSNMGYKQAAVNSGNRHDILNEVFKQSTLMHDLNDESPNEVCMVKIAW